MEGNNQKSVSYQKETVCKACMSIGIEYLDCVCPEPSFTTVEFEGIKYNVSLLNNILFWKKKYARKGVQKHIDDLITIETGVRPAPKSKTSQLLSDVISLVDQINKFVDESSTKKNLDLPF